MTARKAYRATFEEYGRTLAALERLQAAGDYAEIEAARVELEKARRAYSKARDELADELVATRHSQKAAACSV
jgi:hypothetical protein